MQALHALCVVCFVGDPAWNCSSRFVFTVRSAWNYVQETRQPSVWIALEGSLACGGVLRCPFVRPLSLAIASNETLEPGILGKVLML